MTCTKCGEAKPLADFYFDTSKQLHARQCKRCRLTTTPEQKRSSHLRVHFGMTVDEWAAMYAAQGGCCAICRAPFPPLENMLKPRATGKHGPTTFNTDHCHNTGKVRGILCHRCNVALGGLRDTIAIARRCIEYLQRHRVCEHEACETVPAGTCQFIRIICSA